MPNRPKKSKLRGFPGGPEGKTLSSNAGGEGLIPGWRAKLSHALEPKNQDIRQKEYCNKFNKDFKNVHIKKILKKKKVNKLAYVAGSRESKKRGAMDEVKVVTRASQSFYLLLQMR